MLSWSICRRVDLNHVQKNTCLYHPLSCSSREHIYTGYCSGVLSLLAIDIDTVSVQVSFSLQRAMLHVHVNGQTARTHRDHRAHALAVSLTLLPWSSHETHTHKHTQVSSGLIYNTIPSLAPDFTMRRCKVSSCRHRSIRSRMSENQNKPTKCCKMEM